VYLASNYFFRSGQNNDNATLGQASMVIAAEAGGGSFAFGTSSAGSTVTTQRVRIDNDGLKFNADTAAANALDDYEVMYNKYNYGTYKTKSTRQNRNRF
jgi:hypothetical protein